MDRYTLTHERLDELLMTWTRWMMETPEKVLGLGYPSQAIACESKAWGYWEDTAAQEYEAMEYGLAEAVNAAIEDLEPLHRIAVHHEHLAAVFSFARADIGECYWAARQALRAVLPMRGVY